MFNHEEIIIAKRMIEEEKLDVRTVTIGVNLLDCVNSDLNILCSNIQEKIKRKAQNLVPICDSIEKEYGIPIVNKRVSITPISLIAASQKPTRSTYMKIADTLDQTADELNIDYLGGFSALVHKGTTDSDKSLIESLPEVLASTKRVCSSINVATTQSGINMDAIRQMGDIIKKVAEQTKDTSSIGCSKLVVFANAVEDNPFMAGAFHGWGEPDAVVNVGISGPGVIKGAVRKIPGANFEEMTDLIKKTAFKVTRMGQLVAKIASDRLSIPFGIVDLSLAPSPAIGDSVAEIIEAMGIDSIGAPGSTAALAILNDAVKKGGIMASSNIGGLSGAFIPVTEDLGMVEGVKKGSLSLEKLEAMTSVCSVGLDMILLPGRTTATQISGIIADEIAIGVMNNKTTGVRLIPVVGKEEGDFVEYGGLLGKGTVMGIKSFDCKKFIDRGGRIPAPINGIRN